MADIERGLVFAAAAVLADGGEADGPAGDLIVTLDVILQIVAVVHIAGQLGGQLLSLKPPLGVGAELGQDALISSFTWLS